MKLIRFGEINKEKTGIIIDDEYYDTSSFGEDYNEQFFETDGLKRLQDFLESTKEKLPKLPKDIRLGSPVGRPSAKRIERVIFSYCRYNPTKGQKARIRNFRFKPMFITLNN
jgi:hypothetical protein